MSASNLCSTLQPCRRRCLKIWRIFYTFDGFRGYSQKFHPQQQPRYLASTEGFALPRILVNIGLLISGGLKGIIANQTV